MSANEPLGLNDRIETEPAELGPLVVKVIKMSLSKRLAVEYKKPWTEKLESEHQEAISALVAAANSKGLATFKLISVKPDGQRLALDISVEKLSKDRVLQ